MIRSFLEVDSFFFSLFNIQGEMGMYKDIPVRFARREYTTEKFESYPIISILPKIPEPSEEWYVVDKKKIHYFEEKDIDSDGVPDIGSVEYEPERMEMKYSVNCAGKQYRQHREMLAAFFGEFGRKGFFTISGEAVRYDCTYTELEREDGIFEFNVEFNLKIFIYLQQTEDFDLLSRYNIILTQNEK